MANATITGTASNFGSISGVLAGEAGTVAGTITGTVSGTLTGSVGVPGAGVPSDGLEGQILAKASDTSYDTEWIDNYATELRIVARNETGATLAKGTVVYINGAAGNKPTLAKALATGDATSAQTLGMVSADILHNQNGEVTVRGLLAGLDTSAYSAGTQLYLSGTTAGAVTSTKPSAPVHLVYVGIVSRQHANQGQVEVAVMNGFEIGELHDVKITSVSNGQVLKYDSAQGLWVNGTDVGGVAWGGITGTLSAQTDLQTALDGKYAKSGGALNSGVDLTIDYPAGDSNVQLNGQNIVFRDNITPNIYGALLKNQLIINEPGVGYTQITATGVTFPDLTSQTTAFIPANYLSKAGNLSGLADLATSRSNLGLGTMATETASNYLTTSAASSTYAPLASPALTGTPTAPTAAVDTNTTQVATTAYVIGQGYLKSATASSTYAPLASPALTGTPTAPTASAGTNTTQIATTAFVQQEVPAASTTAAGKVELATETENILGTDTSRVLSVNDRKVSSLDCGLWAPGVINLSSAVSGTGANAGSTVTVLQGRLLAPNASTVGYATRGFTTGFISNAGASRYNFGTKSGHSVKVISSTWATTTIVAMKMRAIFGRQGAALPVPGTLAALGYGWEWDMAARQLTILAHDGTSLSTKNVTWNPAASRSYEFTCTSNGSGTISLYVDGVFLDSTTGGPTGYATTSQPWWQLEIENTSTSATGALDLYYQNPKVYTTNG